MRSTEEADRYLERQLAGAGGKARADPRHLRDRAGRRRGEADDAAITRPRHQRRHPVRRPHRLARDPLQPEEPAGDGASPGDQDAAAGTDAGRAEGNGDRDAVAIVVPANAGSHTPRPSCWNEADNDRRAKQLPPVVMGSLRSQGRQRWTPPLPARFSRVDSGLSKGYSSTSISRMAASHTDILLQRHSLIEARNDAR